MRHRIATLDDLPTLVALNRQLVEDEGHRNRSKSDQWFEQRMRGFLAGEYTAVLFQEEDRTVAYALFREQEGSIHLRQFFVCRDCRRRGYGRTALGILREHIWPRDKRVTVGVLCRNTAGYAFWKAMGFADYAIELEMGAPAESSGS
jgi:predicted acetyltransferase